MILELSFTGSRTFSMAILSTPFSDLLCKAHASKIFWIQASSSSVREEPSDNLRVNEKASRRRARDFIVDEEAACVSLGKVKEHSIDVVG